MNQETDNSSRSEQLNGTQISNKALDNKQIFDSIEYQNFIQFFLSKIKNKNYN